MVLYQGSLEPVVLAIDEDYDTLLQDFHHIFVNPKIKERMKRENTRMGLMEIVWWKKWGGGALPPYDSLVTCGNIIAMLRHLKSKNGMDYISIHWLWSRLDKEEVFPIWVSKQFCAGVHFSPTHHYEAQQPNQELHIKGERPVIAIYGLPKAEVHPKRDE
ncbi:hypothetical protein HO173_000461 [Letharia columbiana]|uniref:Uncharacterized protein n=1 Tax=Letharia columbiana TaxID=112416 RepID=A0A8H6G7G9_9LECA|nr:uncharacterized protein HO173_000461 [Letharia columbiana]KAF6241749.1 hypothetical protein HO173_000461 [Letharia columbiana]